MTLGTSASSLQQTMPVPATVCLLSSLRSMTSPQQVGERYIQYRVIYHNNLFWTDYTKVTERWWRWQCILKTPHSLCTCVLPVFVSAEWLDDWKKYVAGGSITFREMSIQGTSFSGQSIQSYASISEIDDSFLQDSRCTTGNVGMPPKLFSGIPLQLLQ
jgi:hypothetical protein